jgi:hypothetical protein
VLEYLNEDPELWFWTAFGLVVLSFAIYILHREPRS